MASTDVTNQDILEALNVFAISVDGRFTAVDKRFTAIDDRFTAIDKRFDQIDLRLSFVENQNHSIGYELREVKQKVEDIDGRLMGVENDIKEIYSYLLLTGT